MASISAASRLDVSVAINGSRQLVCGRRELSIDVHLRLRLSASVADELKSLLKLTMNETITSFEVRHYCPFSGVMFNIDWEPEGQRIVAQGGGGNG